MPSSLNVVQKFFPKVKRIVDANTSAVIEVTKADASSKGIKDHAGCAMAVACKRKFHLDGVIISRAIAYMVKGNKARRFQLPPTVTREVVSFDRGGGFAPGRYTLSAVTPSARLGVKQHTSSHPRNDLPKRKRHITTNVRAVLGGQEPEE